MNDIFSEENKNIKFQLSKKSFIQKIKDFYWAFQPIFWTHHPLCEKFKNHTFHLFNKDLCIGCFIGIPSSIIMLIIGNLFSIFNSLSSEILFKTSLILMSFYLLSLFGLTRTKTLKIISKIPIGIGAAFFIAWIFSLKIGLFYKYFFTFIFIQLFLFIINAIRGLKMIIKCKKCEYKKDWDNCPGFLEVNNKMKLKGFK